MLEQLHWLGHDAFLITLDSVVYIDPFRLAGGPIADLILITHPHRDHCSPEDLAKICGPRTIVVGPSDCLAALPGDTRAITPGETMQIGAIELFAVPAYNINKPYHPKSAGWIGYVITSNGASIYHAGDTDRIPEMSTIRADIALLPIGGTYTMTADEAAAAAIDLRPSVVIPMHYGSIVGSADDAERFQRLLQQMIDVLVKVNESAVVGR